LLFRFFQCGVVEFVESSPALRTVFSHGTWDSGSKSLWLPREVRKP
jgi:hypothetical protein